MRKLRLIPDNTHFRFMRARRGVFSISIALSVLSIIIFFAIGPQYGIDFKGGTLIEMKPLSEASELANVRSTLSELELGDVQVQEVSDLVTGTNIMVRIQAQEGGEEAQQAAIARVRTAFSEGMEFRRVEIVGPRVSSELAADGTTAIIVALIGILIYVWFRFEWQFAVGAVITTTHDVLMTLGFFTIFQLEFDLSSIAALLTILGYSLNDTVVIYDRIRENFRKFKKMPLSDLIDRSINETLARTTMTSVTTLIALGALFLFGGPVIASFVSAMIFGIIIGTYSSIFIAAPLLIYLNLRTGRPIEDGETAAEPAEA
jgi:preprotein translocase subunit SecF